MRGPIPTARGQLGSARGAGRLFVGLSGEFGTRILFMPGLRNVGSARERRAETVSGAIPAQQPKSSFSHPNKASARKGAVSRATQMPGGFALPRSAPPTPAVSPLRCGSGPRARLRAEMRHRHLATGGRELRGHPLPCGGRGFCPRWRGGCFLLAARTEVSLLPPGRSTGSGGHLAVYGWRNWRGNASCSPARPEGECVVLWLYGSLRQGAKTLPFPKELAGTNCLCNPIPTSGLDVPQPPEVYLHLPSSAQGKYLVPLM